VAGITAVLPLHAAHVVAPSAICVPHILQKAIGLSSAIPVENVLSTGIASFVANDVAAKYQKIAAEAINNLD
jgi:hypothetical protein